MDNHFETRADRAQREARINRIIHKTSKPNLVFPLFGAAILCMLWLLGFGTSTLVWTGLGLFVFYVFIEAMKRQAVSDTVMSEIMADAARKAAERDGASN